MALTISITRKAVDLSLLFSLGFKHELGKNEGVKNHCKKFTPYFIQKGD